MEQNFRFFWNFESKYRLYLGESPWLAKMNKLIRGEKMSTVKTSIRILRLKDVQKEIPLSRSYIYYLMSRNKFPKCVKILKDGHGVGWWEHEILNFVQERYKETRGLDNE